VTATAEFSRIGLGYRLWIDDLSTELRISHLKRVSGELHGDLVIRCRIEGVKTVDGVLHAARFNLSSDLARDRLAQLLAKKRAPGIDVDWYALLQELSMRIIATEDGDEGLVDLSEGDVDTQTPKYLVEPIVPAGQPGLLFGPGEAGKSVLGMALALSVVAGREIVPGLAPSLRAPALYLDWETDERTARKRIAALCSGAGIPRPKGLYYHHMVRPVYDKAEDLSTAIREADIRFVILDSASLAMGTHGEHADPAEGALRMYAAVRLFGDGVSSLILDHVSKEEIRDSGNRKRMPIGSVQRSNQARRAWEIRKTSAAGDMVGLTLYDFKANDDRKREPIALNLHWVNGTARYYAANQPPDLAGPEGPPSIGDKIAELLDGSAMLAPDIANMLLMSVDTVRSTLNRDRRFAKDFNGRWTLA
jgi:hypothetical protein